MTPASAGPFYGLMFVRLTLRPQKFLGRRHLWGSPWSVALLSLLEMHLAQQLDSFTRDVRELEQEVAVVQPSHSLLPITSQVRWTVDSACPTAVLLYELKGAHLSFIHV